MGRIRRFARALGALRALAPRRPPGADSAAAREAISSPPEDPPPPRRPVQLTVIARVEGMRFRVPPPAGLLPPLGGCRGSEHLMRSQLHARRRGSRFR